MVKWREGFAFKADAEKVWEELNSVTENGDGLLPEKVVAKARDPRSELHKCFTWDDTEAAEKYRLWQARFVINHLVVTIIDPEDEKIEMDVNYYTSVPAEVGRVYVPTIQSMASPDLRQVVLAEAVKLLKQAQEKLASYNLLSRASSEMIRQLVKRLYRRMRRK